MHNNVPGVVACGMQDGGNILYVPDAAAKAMEIRP